MEHTGRGRRHGAGATGRRRPMGPRALPWWSLVLAGATVALLVTLPGAASDATDPGHEETRGGRGAERADAHRRAAARAARLRLRAEVDDAVRAATRPPTAPLTGVEIAWEELTELERRPAAVVKIPNDARARPHTGIEAADVVYEQETEGGTTRFAAVFHSTIPEVVGNVRSARFVDVPLVRPLDAVFVYAGARGEVLERIERADLVSVGAGGPGYFTDPARRAPHHLYTRLGTAIAERPEASPAPRSPWRFDAHRPPGGLPAEQVRVLMSPIAATGWEHDVDAGVYRRLQNDRPHEVTGPGRIGAANVVLLDVAVPARDSHGAPVYDLDGRGEALLLRDGRAYAIGWAKDGLDGPLDLVDGDEEARLRPGPTWILLTYDGTVDDVRDDLRARAEAAGDDPGGGRAAGDDAADGQAAGDDAADGPAAGDDAAGGDAVGEDAGPDDAEER